MVQAFRVVESLDCLSPVSTQNPVVVQVVIDEQLQENIHIHTPSPLPSDALASTKVVTNGPFSTTALPAGTPAALVSVHTCNKACLSRLPSIPESTPPFWDQNPLLVPLLCGFTRLSAVPLMPVGLEEPPPPQEILYKAPCGLTLCNQEEVMRFLRTTGSYNTLQVDFFTFSPTLKLDAPTLSGLKRPEVDLSRGIEPIPVELCPKEVGALPAEFRYRKDRWPHGCFLSRNPSLFNACCDCVDGCTDPQRCACIALTMRGRHYIHHRLMEPVPSGVYECGPWCSCDRSLCQNRLVQRGIRIRLQVFQTDQCGWGVRCRDDLDRGTFVCIYAGVILQRLLSATEPTPPKLIRCDLPSDDDVEVVTEWLAPPILEARSTSAQTLPPAQSSSTSPPLHMPVIQRSGEATAHTTEAVIQGPQLTETVPPAEPHIKNGQKKESRSNLKRVAKMEDVYLLDASKEGNVSRFFNHSCEPNMFVQNVFTDSHDPGFPVIAFFTNREVKAGTELTWNYCDNVLTASLQKQEMQCLCRSNNCQGQYIVEENLCDLCDIKGHTDTEA
ncbi:histone-lysine N-methyltransferase SETDB2 isoform X2 [Cynoglossus semilaevis]|nr:histone-lysine N-methyltransferase SETDB2 isoform X2 [Cynoglossus semilaevis]